MPNHEVNLLWQKDRRKIICGIVYAHDFTGNPVNNIVMDTFDAQRQRGLQGFGLFDGQENHIVKASKEDNILKWLVNYDSNLLLFHHRFPTSTVNVKRAAHPFSTKDYFGDTQYILVHNGSIGNSYDLIEEHEKLGIGYNSALQDGTFNDSEALLWDFALTMEGKQKEMKAYGRIAFICIKKTKGKLEKMYFARNTASPLNLAREKNGILLSSEGQGESIEPHTLYTWSYVYNRLTHKPFRVEQWAPVEYDYSYSSGINGFHPKGGLLPAYSGDRYFNEYDDETNESYPDSRYGDSWDDWHEVIPTARQARDSGIMDDRIGRQFDKYLKELEDDDQAILDTKASYTEVEVENKAMEYLVAVSGHFESAEWAIESDYEDAMEDALYSGDYTEVVLLERVMEWIANDADYVDTNSVSNIWRSLWNQQQLT